MAGPIRVIRLDEYLQVTCPKCGHRQDAETRRFFGVLKPNTIRWLVVVIVFGILLTVLMFRM